MIRSSKHILKFQTKTKTNVLDQVFNDYKSDLEYYINLIIANELPLKKRLSTKILPINIICHSAWRGTIYNNASAIIRSQIKSASKYCFKYYKKLYIKAKKQNRHKLFTSKKFNQLNLKNILQSRFFTKPKLKNITIILGNHLVDFSVDSKHFDEFIRIRSPYFPENRKWATTICLPFKHHKHSNKYNDWNRKSLLGYIK